MLEMLRQRAGRARFFAKVARATGMLQPVRPGRFVEFLRAASKLPPGPHLITMLQAAAHPDKDAIIEYGVGFVKRMTWGELDATINRLANALLARGVGAAPGSRSCSPTAAST